MTASYLVRLKGQTGSYVALFDNWISLNFNHRVNEVGTLRFEISGDDVRRSLFALDGQIEVWRRDIAANLDWYIEWEGLVRTRTLKTLENGESRYIVYASSYLTLISRRIIAYYADTVYTSKAGTVETIIKEFVEENAGPSATSPPRIELSGVIPGLTVQPDNGNGGSWTGNRAWKPLLEVIQDIANAETVDVDVVGTGPAQFMFMVYNGQRGVDRSLIGYDESTGLNGAGNYPVIFSFAFGNMVVPEATLEHGSETTAVFVLGQGQNDERDVVLQKDDTAIGQSPWNQIEITRSTQETLNAALVAIGNQVLGELRAKEEFNFDIFLQGGRVYGRDFHWGDLVTAEFDDVQYNLKIAGVDITVAVQGDENPEQIRYTISNLTGA